MLGTIKADLLLYLQRDENRLKVLRRKKDHTALNISFTIEGLKWTTNKVGRSLYYKNAFLSKGRFVGDLTPSNDVYVEDYFPQNRGDNRLQSAEMVWVNKAIALLRTH